MIVVCRIDLDDDKRLAFSGGNACPASFHTLIKALDSAAGEPIASRDWPDSKPVGLRFESMSAFHEKLGDPDEVKKIYSEWKPSRATAWIDRFLADVSQFSG